MKNRYLNVLQIPVKTSFEGGNCRTPLVHALLDQYKATRSPSTAMDAASKDGTYALLYLLPLEVLMTRLVKRPLEARDSENYREFLCALFHIAPDPIKIKWLQLELSTGCLAAKTTAFLYNRSFAASSSKFLMSLAMVDVVEVEAKPLFIEDDLDLPEYHLVGMETPNINKYPGIDATHPVSKDIQLTLGDGHGNVLRMIHFLVYQGVMVLTEAHYLRLVYLYDELSKLMCIIKAASDRSASFREMKQINALIKPLLDEFIFIMTRQSSFNQVGLVRWIGDLVGDRGVLDYLVLKLLDCLKKSGVPFEILLSNHDLNLILWYELCVNNPLNTIDFKTMSPYFTTFPCDSFEHMLLLIDSGLLQRYEILRMIEFCYKPALKLVGYSVNEKATEAHLFTHAAIQEEVLPVIAEQLGCIFDTASIEATLSSIDDMNQAIQMYVQANRLMSILDQDRSLFETEHYNDKANPFLTILWNKDLNLRSFKPIARCHIVLVHGHECVKTPCKGFVGLDTLLGQETFFHDASNPSLKACDRERMVYSVLYSRHLPGLALELLEVGAGRYKGGFFAPLMEPDMVLESCEPAKEFSAAGLPAP